MRDKNNFNDRYIHGMDWFAADGLKDNDLTNYQKYQFDLIGKYIGKNILEVGSGGRKFTNLIVKNIEHIEQIVSIEPSLVMNELSKNKFKFPDYVKFYMTDLFDLTPSLYGVFDTIILVHVLEHIENDRKAVSHLYDLLAPEGKILIEVPAMQFLFSTHDEILGHYRRYNKMNFKAMVDSNLFKIIDLWYQDEIGMVGSYLYFKLLGIKLKSDQGIALVKKQGGIYDKYVIPLESFIEKYLRFPFGLSLAGILEKK